MAEILACPKSDELANIALGHLPEANAAALIEHIATCSNCVTRLQSIAAEDSLVEAVGSKDLTPAWPEQDAVRRLLEKVRGLVAETKGEQADQTRDLPAPVSNGDTPNFSWVDSPDQSVKEDDGLAPPKGADEIGWLGPYRVLKVLGEGGMGKVFLAEDPALQRSVALKVMKPSLARNLNSRKRFLQEARAAAAIEHDNIIHIYQVSEDRGVPFVAMPLLKGASLEDLLRRAGALQLKQTVRIGSQIAEGLAAAHERKLIHRDIKPGNIWIEPTGGGRVKILDFGLARTTEGDTGLTQSGAILGTPAYMPPEQARGEKVDHRADLYSLGCVLYRMATGELPLKGNDTMGMLMALAMQEPTAPKLVKPEVPQALSDLIMKLLAKDPAQRFGSAREVVVALKAIESGAAGPAKSETAILSQSMLQPAAALPMATVPPSAEPTNPFTFKGAAHEVSGATNPLSSCAAPPRRRKPLLVVGVAFLGICLIAAGIFGIIRISTPDGDYVFQTDDPNFKLSLNKDTVILEDKLKNRTYNLKVLKQKSGEFELEVTDPGNDLVFSAKTFTIKRGEAVGLKAWFERKADAAAIAPPKKGDDTPIAKTAAWKPVPFGQSPLDKLDPAAIPPEERFDWQPKELVAALGSHRQRLWGQGGGVAISGDGNRVVAGGVAPLTAWDFDTGKEIGRNGGSRRPALSADGKRLFDADCIFEFDDWAKAQDQDAVNKMRAGALLAGDYDQNAQFSADGSVLIAEAGYGKGIAVWHFGKNAKRIGEWPGFFSPALSVDGKMIAMVHVKDRTVHLFETKGDKVQPRFVLSAAEAKTPELNPTTQWKYLGFTREGRLGVLALDRKSIAFWDVAGAKPQQVGSVPVDAPNFFLFAAKSPRMVTSDQSSIQIWRLTEKSAERESGISMHDLNMSRPNIGDVAISADGNRLVSSHLNGAVAFWEVKEGKLAQRNPLTAQPANSSNQLGANLHFSPTGEYMTTQGEAGHTVWHFGGKSPKGFLPSKFAVSAFPGPHEVTGQIGEERVTWRLTPTAIKKIGSHPVRGDILVSSESGLALDLFQDAKSKKRNGRVIDLKEPTGPPGKPFEIGGITDDNHETLSADGRVFASWVVQSDGNTHTIRVFDLHGGKATKRYDIKRSESGVNDTQRIRLSPDGHWLAASWGNGGRGQIWRLEGEGAKPERGGESTGGFSPDGKRIAIFAEGHRKLEIRDIESWDLLWSTRIPGGMNDAVFAPDGRHLLVANANQTAYILRLHPPIGTKELPKVDVVVAPAAGQRFALLCDGMSKITMPSLELDASGPFTMEAYLTKTQDTKDLQVPITAKGLLTLSCPDNTWKLAAARPDGHYMIQGRSVILREKIHLAGVYDGKTLRLYADGTRVGETLMDKGPLTPGKWPLILAHGFTGIIGEIRISKVARYRLDFTPALRFQPDADTLALYHFDEGSGDVLKDSSGNNHHGKIVGAKWVKPDGTPVGSYPPLDPAWVKAVAAMPARDQVQAVADKLQERNPGFDGNVESRIGNDGVWELAFVTDKVADLSPVRALTALTSLRCGGGFANSNRMLADLTPLKGMKLQSLTFADTRVSDLSPLKDMPLAYLDCHATLVSNLSPLKGMKLTELNFNNTKVSGLSPLKDMPLTKLFCYTTLVSNLSPLKGMKLTELDCSNTKVSDLSPLKDMPLTSLRCVVTSISDLSPLKGMNLVFLSVSATSVHDLTPLKGMKLTGLWCDQTKVSDLAPLQGMPLTRLNCEHSLVSSLAPLKGMKLTDLLCQETKVSDLTPLKDMPLTKLDCSQTAISDLSPLKGMKLTILQCYRTKVPDLAPLQGMPLTDLNCDHTPVSNLAPLQGMKLTGLSCNSTKVSDLAPLRGMPLRGLACVGTQVVDLSPLKGLPLEVLNCDFKAERDAGILRTIKTLKGINGADAKEMLK